MITFLLLIALAVIGYSVGRLRRAPAFLDGAAIAALAGVALLTSAHILALVVGVLILAGGFVGGAAGDVKRMRQRKLGGGGGGLLKG